MHKKTHFSSFITKLSVPSQLVTFNNVYRSTLKIFLRNIVKTARFLLKSLFFRSIAGGAISYTSTFHSQAIYRSLGTNFELTPQAEGASIFINNTYNNIEKMMAVLCKIIREVTK